jgi:23S rRNA (adenine2503-C2)-methyltransferase
VDAAALAALTRPLAAHVNLIPLNPTPGYPTRGTPPAGVAAFRDLLGALGINATVRGNRGSDIDAACGQLAVSTPVVRVRTKTTRAVPEQPTSRIDVKGRR